MEIEEKDEVIMTVQNRLKEPLTWISPSFAKIIDLKESHYDEVIRLIKHHFLKEEPMSKSSFLLDDEESVNGYLNLARVWMKDTTSIVALSSISGRVIGTAIARINSNLDRTNTYSRVQIFEGKTLEKIMHLKSQLVKQAEAYKFFNSDSTFRVYILCCHPSYRDKHLETILLETCIHVASSLGLPAIIGVFTSGLTQRIATNLGFEILSEIRYSRWIVDDRIVFHDPGIDNYSAAFMGMFVPGKEELQMRERVRISLYKKGLLRN